jgi:hypothetical protein
LLSREKRFWPNGALNRGFGWLCAIGTGPEKGEVWLETSQFEKEALALLRQFAGYPAARGWSWL